MNNNKKQKLELTWIGKDEQIKLEPRILIEDPEKSYGEKNSENMLIYGDNLLALKALEQDFTGKIKCIYIDPPYNINAAGVPYEDNVEHSLWLSLIKPRLQLLKNLLSDDGIIFIQIDDGEQAYLKILCDEIFGRCNFVSMIVVESGEVFGTKAAHLDKTFVKVKDYILVYFKDGTKRMKLKTLWTSTPEVFDSHYSVYISKNLEKTTLLEYLKNIDWVSKLFVQYGIKLKMDNISKVMKLDNKFRDFINLDIANNIFQDQPFSRQLDKDILKKFETQEIIDLDGIYLFQTKSGSVRYYHPFSAAIHKTDDYESIVGRSTARGDLWKNYHIDMRNIDNEGGVKLKNSKKPERLIKDILSSYTNKGDLVLDSFLGSGTTAAVAHKMGRRWIGVELEEHCYTHCIPRLKKVCDGTDQSGISKTIDWKGGGGFKFYTLAPSLLKKDNYDNWVIDEEYNADMLAATMAKHEGFKYQPDEHIYWKQGQSTEKDFIFTTTQFVTVEFLDKINEEMKDGESLLICAKSFQKACGDKYSQITVKKIPQMLLGRCEFGKEDYKLNIIDLPEEGEEDE